MIVLEAIFGEMIYTISINLRVRRKTNFNKKIFHYICVNILSNWNIKNLSSDRLEGDDIVYITQKNLKK